MDEGINKRSYIYIYIYRERERERERQRQRQRQRKSGILFSIKRKGISDTCRNMGELCGLHAS